MMEQRNSQDVFHNSCKAERPVAQEELSILLVHSPKQSTVHVYDR